MLLNLCIHVLLVGSACLTLLGLAVALACGIAYFWLLGYLGHAELYAVLSTEQPRFAENYAHVVRAYWAGADKRTDPTLNAFWMQEPQITVIETTIVVSLLTFMIWRCTRR